MLISDIDALKAIIPTIASADFNRYKPFLASAELWLKREITGKDVFDKLTDAGNDDILALAQTVVANKAYLEGIPFLDLIETETGFGVVNNGNIAPASKERVESLRKHLDKAISDASEDLIIYLEENSDWHTDWKSSPAYSLVSGCLLRSLTVFNQYAPFAGNRREFVKVIPVMVRIQKLVIEPAVSSELLAALIDGINADNLSANMKTVVEILRYALALFTVTDRQYRQLFIDSPYMLRAVEEMAKDTNPQQFIDNAFALLVATPADYPPFADTSVYAQYLANMARTTSTDDPFLTTAL